MSKKLDSKIRNMLNQDCEIPESIQRKVQLAFQQVKELAEGETTNDALKNGRAHRLREGNFSRIVGAAVIVAAFVLLFSIGAPQKAYSVMSSVFSHFTKQDGLNVNYEKLSQQVNAIARSNGVEITVDKSVADPLGLTFGYQIQTDKLIKGGQLVIAKVKIEGKEVIAEPSSVVYKDLGNNRFEGYQSLKIRDLPAKFTMELEISQIGDVNGQWQVKLNGESDKARQQSYVSTQSFEKTSANGTLRIDKLVATPLNTLVSLTYKSKTPIDSNDKLGWASVLILTDKNTMATVDSVSSRLIDQFTYETEFYLKDYKGALNGLQIIPYKAPVITKEARSLDQDYDFYGFSKKVPFIWKSGGLGSITVNSVTDGKDKITVNCSIEGKYNEFLLNAVGVSPKVNTSYKAISNFNPLYYNGATVERLKGLTSWKNITLEFDKDPSYQGDYVLVFNKYYQNITPYEDLAITIPVF